MTLRKYFEQKLEEHGLWPQEAVQVMDAAEQSDLLADMQGRWDQSSEGYPPQLLVVVWMSVKLQAKRWLTDNVPQHFALGMFQ